MSKLPHLKSTFIVSALSFLYGCASTTVFPEGNNRYSLVSTSFSESSALEDAKKKATEVCNQQNQTLIVLKHKSVYQGIDKRDKAIIDIADTVLNGNTTSTSNSDDYKVTMKFRCSN